MPLLVEHCYTCPYCGESISSLLDLSANAQQYTEDCEVCCQPIEITYSVVDAEIANFTVTRSDD
ncbi:MAG: CPXCG motif-containing cysteine-rich protein [Gammaproteobacteria bacterium]